MDPTEPIHRADSATSGLHYGAIVRRLTSLCQQVDALSAPLPAPPTPNELDLGTSTPQDLEHRQATPTSAPARGGAQNAGVGGISIPRLVLVGGQSTGKSSLVECLAGVSLPRSQGTCTRGPLDIVITSAERTANGSDGWSATVSLVLPANLSPSISNTGGVVQFGPPITDPTDVADRLRRATLAVRDLATLPSVMPSSPKSASASPPTITTSPYQHMSLEELQDAEDDSSTLPTFFPAGARLALSIRAPDVEPLRFTDLPGLISEGSAAEVNAIHKMVSRDIAQDNVIIVLTASLAMDIRHQNAFSLVRKVDPAGSRTIGVLTMPDRMPAGAERQWAKLINQSSPNSLTGNASVSTGKQYLKHGWHVVRCPSQRENRADIGGIERAFFHPLSTPPAAAVPWHETAAMLDGVGEGSSADFVATRCGLGNLSCHLSRLLLEQIRATLPGTISACTRLAEELAGEYAAAMAAHDTGLPKSAGLHFGAPLEQQGRPAGGKDFDTMMELVRLVDTLTQCLSFSDVAISNELVPHLKAELKALAPVYLPFTSEEAADRDLVAVYKPRGWSFIDVLDKTISPPGTASTAPSWLSLEDVPPNNAAADDDLDDPRTALSRRTASDASQSRGSHSTPNTLAHRPTASKKPTTIDDIITLLRSEPTLHRNEAPFVHLNRLHQSLQTKFKTFIQTYTTFCRTHLVSLLQNAIPKSTRTTYAQLCTDVIAIATDHLQSQLALESHKLANMVSVHPLEGLEGLAADSDRVGAGVVAGAGAGSEYARWVQDELFMFMMIRVSIEAKHRADAGDKTYLSDHAKAIDLLRRHETLPRLMHDSESITGSAGFLAASFGGRSRAAGVTDVDEIGESSQAVRKRKPKPTAAAALSPSGSGDKTPSPEPGSSSSGSSPPTPTTPTPAPRKRAPSTAGAVSSKPTVSALASASQGAVSTGSLPLHRPLAFLSPLLAWKKPWLCAALQLMADLRADFNFFSLLVAREAQRMPNSVVRGLQAHLRHTLSQSIRARFSEDELYHRYFFEADRPRRERFEWLDALGARVGQVQAVIQQLKHVGDQLEGHGEESGESTTPAAAATRRESTAKVVTPTAVAMLPLEKVSPRTPRAASQPTSSLFKGPLETPIRQKLPYSDQRDAGYLKSSVTPQKRRLAPATFDDTPPRNRLRTLLPPAPARKTPVLTFSSELDASSAATEYERIQHDNEAQQADVADWIDATELGSSDSETA